MPDNDDSFWSDPFWFWFFLIGFLLLLSGGIRCEYRYTIKSESTHAR